MHVLFSIHPKYLDLIFGQKKTVELRNRPVRLTPNSRVWLYATRPRKRLEGWAVAVKVVNDTPANVWRQFKGRLGITKAEFSIYVGSKCMVSAIQLERVERFAIPLRLKSIREQFASFQPPQFYVHLSAKHRLYGLLLSHAASNRVAKIAEGFL